MFAVMAAFIGVAGIVAGRFLGRSYPDADKCAPYECGFDAFEMTHRPFNIRFYLVSVLFILFDVETAFLFPWAVTLRHLQSVGFWAMIVFLGILTIGFIHEWRKGALTWE